MHHSPTPPLPRELCSLQFLLLDCRVVKASASDYDDQLLLCCTQASTCQIVLIIAYALRARCIHTLRKVFSAIPRALSAPYNLGHNGFACANKQAQPQAGHLVQDILNMAAMGA